MISTLKKIVKALPNTYYNWRKRNERIDALLSNYAETMECITKLQQEFNTFKIQFQNLQDNVNTMVSRLDTIKQGTRIELFNTLHDWRELLVVKRGWASPEQKHEIENIYLLYSGEELKGNGTGDRYYKEIMALPESKEEMEVKKGV